MKRIWILWAAAGYVIAHIFIVPAQLYFHLWWQAAVGIVFTIVVGKIVWQRRGYLIDPSEY